MCFFHATSTPLSPSFMTRSAPGTHCISLHLATIMSLLALNDDILRTIAEMLSAAECISLSSYVFASITVSRMEQLVPMHDHLIRNIDNRLIWPRELSIHYSMTMRRPADAAIDALVGILEHARELKVLAVRNCEELIHRDARVGEHLAALPNLSDIRLISIGTKTLDVLRKMVSRPERAMLSAALHHQAPTDIARLPALDNVKELTLDFFLAASQPQHLSSFAGAYPQIEILCIHASAVYPSLILFPNVRKLTLCGSTSALWEHNLPVAGHRMKRHLDYLDVATKDLPIISTLGIRSDSLHINIRFDSPEVDNTELVSAAAVLRLHLQQSGCDERCVALARMVSTNSSRVRYLVLTINSPCQDLPLVVTQWIDNITPLLSSSQLICIRVHLVHRDQVTWERGDAHRFLQLLEGAHISAIPSLRFYFQGRGEGGIDDPSVITWGRVEGDEGRRTVQPIPNWQGERIHRYLQSSEFCRTLRFDEVAALNYTGR
ncbi:uncharacterized protein B0H18DRAFT_955630 [Fomitopsis serialis]|uniref:uncharacterized protein n=1 Tax=Fomitopsis serialis TaxID=139415 RepID=UPI0020089020|nr:uncharacterized protein B0H18DRAFT_955630 [Neoantrodia serialis]KAH9924043.1 hypothetical protein B0H18DRAFT_955630 [Neoantrodia serialis]